MKNKNIITLGVLIILTVVTGLVSENHQSYQTANMFIMLLSGLKFLLVAFQFMELKKANIFWKMTLIVFIILFTSLVLII